MKEIIFSIIIAAILTWVFATGNLPFLMPSDARSVDQLNNKYPTLSSVTYKASHSALEALRRKDHLNIPLSHREKIAKMKEDLMSVTAKRIEHIKIIRAEVAMLCDEILADAKSKQ